MKSSGSKAKQKTSNNVDARILEGSFYGLSSAEGYVV